MRLSDKWTVPISSREEPGYILNVPTFTAQNFATQNSVPKEVCAIGNLPNPFPKG